MVNVNSVLAFGLLAATASAATLKHDKRHNHHRRHNKEPCTTGTVAPFPVSNSTMPAGTGGFSSTTTTTATSTTKAVVTVSVVPVPIGSVSAPVEPSSVQTQPTVLPGAPSQPAGSVCGVATSYVTVQQTVTVTAGQLPDITAPAPVVVPTPSSSSETSTSSVVAPVVSTPVETTPVPQAGGFLQGAQPVNTPAPVEEPSVATSAPVTTSTPVTPVKGSTYSGKKMGTSWNPMQNRAFSDLGVNVGASWVYDWEQTPNGIPSGVEFIPTLHDAEKCSTFAEKMSASGANTFKHFNEPDQHGNGGSGISVGQAVDLHNTWIKPLASKYSVGLPAVTSNNNDPNMGVNWLIPFIQQAGCEDFSFADFHFYGGGEEIEKQAEIFLGYVDDWIKVVDEQCPGKNLPLWISEFSHGPADGDASKAARFMAVAGPALEANSRVARYAYWFPVNTGIASALGAIVSALTGAK